MAPLVALEVAVAASGGTLVVVAAGLVRPHLLQRLRQALDRHSSKQRLPLPLRSDKNRGVMIPWVMGTTPSWDRIVVQRKVHYRKHLCHQRQRATLPLVVVLEVIPVRRTTSLRGSKQDWQRKRRSSRRPSSKRRQLQPLTILLLRLQNGAIVRSHPPLRALLQSAMLSGLHPARRKPHDLNSPPI
jgi:hypothetical protein